MAQTDTVVVGAIKTQIVCVHECALGQSVLSFDYSVGVFLVLHSGVISVLMLSIACNIKGHAHIVKLDQAANRKPAAQRDRKSVV